MNYLIRGDIRLENVLISVKIIKNYNMSYISLIYLYRDYIVFWMLFLFISF